MNNEVHEAYLEGAQHALEKVAGLNSELIGSFVNPLNWVGGTALGGLMGFLRKNAKRRKGNINSNSMWRNLLVPGVAPYRMATRQRAALTNN